MRRAPGWMAAAVLFMGALAQAQDPPLDLHLGSEVQGSALLAAGLDPVNWAAGHQLSEYRVRALQDGRALVSFAVSKVAWAERRATLCAGPSVLACAEDPCHGAQRRAQSDPGAFVTLRPAPPEIAAAIAGGVAVCASAHDPYAAGGSAAPVGPSETIDLAALPSGSDAACWQLVVADGCRQSTARLSTLIAERIPHRTIARVSFQFDGAQVARELAVRYGLEVELAVGLESIEEWLLVLRGAEERVAMLAADSRVSFRQPEFVYRTQAEPSAAERAATYGPDRIGATRLHARATGTGVRVAMIDTGVDPVHPEYAERVVQTFDTTGGAPRAEEHGTALASLIGGASGNGQGGDGVAPGVELLAIRACEPVAPAREEARCRTSAVAQALDLALGAGARVINLGFAGPPDPLVATLVERIAELGVLLVAPAGTGGRLAPPAYPAALDGVLAVAATDDWERPWSAGRRGLWVDLAAPGVGLLTATPHSVFRPRTGTSLATALASGAAALLMELSPSLEAGELRDLLRSSARDLGSQGRDPLTGAGRLDVCAAARELLLEEVCAAP